MDNVHGFYKHLPKLDFNLIPKLKKGFKILLVLDGGSWPTDEDFIMAIHKGISKINFFIGMTYTATQWTR